MPEVRHIHDKRLRMKKAIVKSARGLWNALPMIIGTIMLISLLFVLVPKSLYTKIFSGNVFSDPLIGSTVGSISAGNPVTSYILGGELLRQGTSLISVTAFLIAWVTVGIVQLPAESAILGKRFALLRNATSFILSIITAIVTVILIRVI